MRKWLFGFLFIAALAWAAYAANVCLLSWPHISLDLSHIDEGTRAAHGQAVTAHVLRHMVVGLVPMLVVGAIYWFSGRRR